MKGRQRCCVNVSLVLLSLYLDYLGVSRMRGFSLLVLVVGLLFTGYLYQRNVDETVHPDRGEPATQHIEQQAKDILRQYQTKLDKQAENH